MRIISLIITFILVFASCGDKPKLSKFVNAESGLLMRTTPDLKGNKIRNIPNYSEVFVIEESGETINLSGKDGKWTKITYNGTDGWVFGGFLVMKTNLPPFSNKKYYLYTESENIFKELDSNIELANLFVEYNGKWIMLTKQDCFDLGCEEQSFIIDGYGIESNGKIQFSTLSFKDTKVISHCTDDSTNGKLNCISTHKGNKYNYFLKPIDEVKAKSHSKYHSEKVIVDEIKRLNLENELL